MATLLDVPQNFSTTLNVGGGIDDSQTSGIVLTSVSGLPTTGGMLCFDWASPLDIATAEYIEYGGISGNTLTGVVRGQEGLSAKAHTNQCTIVGILSKAHINRINDKLDGTDTSGITVADFHATTNDPSIATGLNIQVNDADPKRGFYIPATALFPATTNGCAAHAQGETTTNKINYKYLAFDASTEEYAWIHLPTPDNWDLSTVTITFHWTFASSSGDVIWGAAGLCRSNDDALDTALGTAQTVTDTALTAGDEHTTSATSAITIGGTPAKGDKLYLRVYRDADAGGDTLGADAYLMGITVKYGIGQYDDQ